MALASGQWSASAELGDRFADARLIHAGSRFTIYEARETGSDRRVAIKVPDESRGSWLYDAIETEGAVLSAIGAHPHVLTCYQRTTLADGRPALVLERCPQSLYESMHSHDPMPMRDVVAIGIKLAGGLEAAHRFGVLHCDLRPANILLSEWGEPVLAGWDEAVEMRNVGDRPPLHELTAHTAPELLEGGQPSTATDVYGLASSLYELAAGRAAFRAYVGESPASVIVRVLSSPVLPIVAPDVPLEMSDLLTWALSPDPAERPPSPAWLAEELGRIERRQGWPRTRMVGA